MPTHYLGVTDGFDTEDYDLYAIFGDDRDTLLVENLSQLTSFANMDDTQIEKMKSCCNVDLDSPTFDEYIQAVTQSITESFGESAANIITLELINDPLFSAESMGDSQDFSIEDAQKILHKNVTSATTAAKAYCYVLSEFFESDLETQHRQAHILVTAIPPNIRYFPLAAISKKTQKVTYCNAFFVSKVWDFFTLMGVFTIKGDKPIRRCKNCNKYFIPTSKKDEIYCLSCRDVSYDKKIREDEILSSYRKIYKTQSARKTRNAHRPQINEKFEHWKRMAISKRNDCKAGLITLTEMESAISSQDWLNGNGGTNGND